MEMNACYGPLDARFFMNGIWAVAAPAIVAVRGGYAGVFLVVFFCWLALRCCAEVWDLIYFWVPRPTFLSYLFNCSTLALKI
jgi:hypothetical protein